MGGTFWLGIFGLLICFFHELTNLLISVQNSKRQKIQSVCQSIYIYILLSLGFHLSESPLVLESYPGPAVWADKSAKKQFVLLTP